MGTTRKRRGMIFDGGKDARDEPWRDEKEEKERSVGGGGMNVNEIRHARGNFVIPGSSPFRPTRPIRPKTHT